MKWIKRYDDTIKMYIDAHHICSHCEHECFYSFYDNKDILTPYCPWCGEKSEERKKEW